MSARSKGICYRSTQGKLSLGLHEPLISAELWQQCQAVRESRRQKNKTRQVTRHIYLLNGIVVCSHCGRRLRAQTPKGWPGYYREVSHLNGFQDCPCSRKSVRTTVIDEQIAHLIQSLMLPPNWELEVRKMLREKDTDPDPELQRREISEQLRRMRNGYERGMYQDEENLYWREVEALQEKLAKLAKPQVAAINQAAETLLNLRGSWKNATQEEQRELVHLMLQEVGCSIPEQRVIWVKPRLEFEILLRLVDDLKPAENGRFLLLDHNGHKRLSGK